MKMDKGIMSKEHRKAISLALKKKYSTMTEKEWEERTRKRVQKAKIKNILFKKYEDGLITI